MDKSPVSSWTEGRFKTFITSILRAGWRKFPNRYECLRDASVGKKLNSKSGRLAEHYVCALCKKEFPGKEVVVDHVEPVVEPKQGFVDWNTFIDRLYCSKENLQVLCGFCHDKKTADERVERKKC